MKVVKKEQDREATLENKLTFFIELALANHPTSDVSNQTGLLPDDSYSKHLRSAEKNHSPGIPKESCSSFASHKPV